MQRFLEDREDEEEGKRRQVISDEIWATLVHHVVVHERTMKESLAVSQSLPMSVLSGCRTVN